MISLRMQFFLSAQTTFYTGNMCKSLKWDIFRNLLWPIIYVAPQN